MRKHFQWSDVVQSNFQVVLSIHHIQIFERVGRILGLKIFGNYLLRNNKNGEFNVINMRGSSLFD
jgi:hypothetical protein